MPCCVCVCVHVCVCVCDKALIADVDIHILFTVVLIVIVVVVFGSRVIFPIIFKASFSLLVINYVKTRYLLYNFIADTLSNMVLK